MLKNFSVSWVIFMAILFKLAFFNVAAVAGNFVIQDVSSESIFKVGKKRRRLINLSLKNPTLSIEEDVLAGEKEENEDPSRKIVEGCRLSFLTLLVPFLRSVLNGTVLNKSGFAHCAKIPIPVVNHPAVSILRI